MQRVVLGQAITLEATFTTGTGAVTDPSSLFASVTDYQGVERVSNATPTRLALGQFAFTYPVPGDGPVGAWTLRWDGVIDGGPVSAVEVFDVIAPGAVTPTTASPSWVPLAEVEVALGRALTDPERLRATQLIGQLVRLLERRWNRDLLPRTIVGERHTIGPTGRLDVNHGPDARVTAVRTLTGLASGVGGWYVPGTVVEVDYTTPGLRDADDVVGVIVAAVAGALRADAARAGTTATTESAGPVKSFSVEGLSISYGGSSSTTSGGASGSGDDDLVVGSLKGLGRLRRPVLLP